MAYSIPRGSRAKVSRASGDLTPWLLRGAGGAEPTGDANRSNP
jgi:hypothetical protein